MSLLLRRNLNHSFSIVYKKFLILTIYVLSKLFVANAVRAIHYVGVVVNLIFSYYFSSYLGLLWVGFFSFVL